MFREEDNDDIVPLIDEYSTNLKDFYGEFYVAEIIQSIEDQKLRETRDRNFIVAEVNILLTNINNSCNFIHHPLLRGFLRGSK